MKYTRDVLNERIGIVKDNLHLSNQDIGKILGISVYGIKQMMKRNKIKRPPDVLHKIQSERSRKNAHITNSRYNFKGENSPTWKGGISKDNYRYTKIQNSRFPEKVSARRKVHSAVRAGKLIKTPCEVCGLLPSHGHHEDYSKPLEVIWLCRKHHREKHNNKH